MMHTFHKKITIGYLSKKCIKGQVSQTIHFGFGDKKANNRRI